MSELSIDDVIRATNEKIEIRNPITNRWSRVHPSATASGKRVCRLWQQTAIQQTGGGTDMLTDLPVASIPSPDPQYQPWYHYHQSNVQDFGGYVCIKKGVLEDIGTFLGNLMK